MDEGAALDALTWYADTDADGHGDPDTSTTACEMPDGYLLDDTDCDDDDDEVSPSTHEVCDGKDNDNDCDSAIDFDGWLPGDYADLDELMAEHRTLARKHHSR